MGFFSKLKNIFKSADTKTRERLIEEYEDVFLESDFGSSLSASLSEVLQERAKKEGVKDDEGFRRIIKEELSTYIKTYSYKPEKGKLSLCLLLGVNGSGKTTTSAKLALRFKNEGYSVMLSAADTFRAAAISQVKIHSEKLDVDVTAPLNAGNPAAVIYESFQNAEKRKTDIIIADTAGRLHTKDNLLKEMQKIDKIVHSRISKEQYVKFLVLDGTSGQNLYSQAQNFDEALGIDAIILTKLDSGAKGGGVLRILKELHLPIAYICTGEGYNDIEEFDKDKFIEGLLD